MALVASSLSPALMVNLAILYEHLASCMLADATEGHCANSVLPPMSEDLPKQLKATFYHLDTLLRHVFWLVIRFQQANLTIDVVCLQEAYCRLECLVEMAGEQGNLVETRGVSRHVRDQSGQASISCKMFHRQHYAGFTELCGLGASQFPNAAVFRSMAILGVDGFSSLPENYLTLCYICFVAAIVVNLIRDLVPMTVSRFVPIPTAMAIPFYIGSYFAIDMFIRTVILFVWQNLDRAKAETFGPTTTFGLICGDGLWFLPQLVLTLAKVNPPIYMKFLSRRTND